MNQIKCENCQIVPEKFVCLDCEHSFCLSCLAKLFKQYDNQIQCITCFEITILDDETINALMDMKLQQLQPPVIIPYTTSKKQNNQKELIQIKGHPFIEKLNVSIEKCLDNIRIIQFDKQKIREISNKIKSELETEFKSLHIYLDNKLESFMNEISKFETLNSTNLQSQEDGFQIDIKEMQIMKDEIKSLLQSQTGISNDIEQFKIILNQIDEITIKTNQQYQSHLKLFQDEIYKIPLKWTDFSCSYKALFNNFDQTKPISISQYNQIIQFNNYHIFIIQYYILIFLDQKRTICNNNHSLQQLIDWKKFNNLWLILKFLIQMSNLLKHLINLIYLYVLLLEIVFFKKNINYQGNQVELIQLTNYKTQVKLELIQ